MIQAAPGGPMTSGEHQSRGVVIEAPGARGGRSLAGYDDETLMARVRDGDKEAFEVLVGRHSDLVLSLSSRFLADPEAGRDVAQEVFLDLWSGRDRYEPKGKFKGFLATLTLNRCRDATRRRGSELRRRVGLAAEGHEPRPDPADETSRHQSARMLLDALGALEAEDREILVMRYGMDLPYDEISGVLGRPAGTLRSRVFHALRKMRSVLEEGRS